MGYLRGSEAQYDSGHLVLASLTRSAARKLTVRRAKGG